MTNFDHDDVIRALRAAGTDSPESVLTPLSETTRRARAARRRRHVIAGTAAAALAVGAVTTAIAMPPLWTTPNELTVAPAVPAASPTSPSPPAMQPPVAVSPATPSDQAAVNRQIVLGALPRGFVEVVEENLDDTMRLADLAIAQDSPAIDGLPAGMSGGATFFTFLADDPGFPGSAWCDALEEKGTTMTACRDLRVGESVVQVQDMSRPLGGQGGAWEAIRTTFVQPDGDVVVLDLYVWENDHTTTPDRQAAARAWLQDLHLRIFPVVANPAIQPPERAGGIPPDVDIASCAEVTPPPPDVEWESVLDVESGIVMVFFTDPDTGANVQFTIDYRGDPWCRENPELALLIEHVLDAQ